MNRAQKMAGRVTVFYTPGDHVENRVENCDENKIHHAEPELITCWDHEEDSPNLFWLEDSENVCMCRIQCQKCGFEIHGLEWSSNSGFSEALEMMEKIADGTYLENYFDPIETNFGNWEIDVARYLLPADRKCDFAIPENELLEALR